MSTVSIESLPQDRLPAASSQPKQQRVVIVGGGFAGIAAAQALRKSDVEIILMDRRNHHIFQPLLYQVATAVLAPSEIATSIRQLEAKQKNLSVVLAEVTGINLRMRTIEAIYPGLGIRKIEFDYLVIATGMRPSYFGHDEFAAHAPGLKSLNDAETIRTKILGAFELAESTEDETERARQMTFVLVGAGPTGVELAASIAHMVSVTLRNNFRRIDPAKSRIVLVDGGDRILPSFAETLSRKVVRRLERLGVEVRTGLKVEKVDEQGVVASGERITSATVLWTAGVTASPVVKMLGTTTDRAGRALIGPFMDIPEAPNVFVAGDATSMTQDGYPVPGVAQAAIQQGRFAGRLIVRRVEGRSDGRPFRYRSRGNMAVVGKNFAILEAGRMRTSGFVTWMVWATLHVLALPLLQNRFRVQIQWIWSYLSGQRSSRLIAEAPRSVEIPKQKSAS
ncbi:NAD(P)/FAD-dependent oxidoreductase [Bradyrhizobium sp. AS23.2]|uniref:NAD(P)/FAD-dependent oxidoreductase n=1 Tax=Bradyrhizobium sp. AS23.2 TaxID=1680155 RepID=UPI00093F995F|nr:NAD(P)/FAD-dependent oxidoreductase [Bradyrhizobium sp. AS23.2]OKO76017.1 pyridine nucleotide-disulfide oxidoreductase [Bradyrhizobium sp. AS23.2]